MRRASFLRILLTVLLLDWATCAQPAPRQTDFGARVNALLAKMTLEEKVGQLNQADVDKTNLEHAIAAGKVGSVVYAAGAVQTNNLQRIAIERSRLRIPLLFGYDVTHGYRTIFPIPLGLASTWDPGAVETMARISAREASAAGVRWTFSPVVDITRDPRWGRIGEGAGEDPVLSSALAAAYVRGYQGTELAAPTSIAACAKHYVGYGAAEGGRDYNTVDMSEGRLREVYFPPFKAAADAGVATFMSSFNTLNGVPATANHFTLRQVLKGEWGFRGFVVSDNGSISELVAHGVAANKRDAAREALMAGVDMDMVSGAYIDNIADLVRSGTVPMSVVDDAVRRILRVKLKLGLFERPYVDEQHEADVLLTVENRAAARAIAQKSIVLLRNESNVLPLPKSVGAIAVIGPLADSKADMLGSSFGEGSSTEAVSVLGGIRAKGATTLYSKGVDVATDASDGIAAAVQTAREADVIILVLGESSDLSGEAGSRASLDLPGQQEKLLEALVATGKKVVLVLMGGRPLAIPWAAEHVPAILEAWFPGSEGGNAIADVVFGDVNPSGRLPISIPRAVGQLPIHYSHLNTGRPAGADPHYHTGYLDLPSSPLYPFGYGLSYSKFSYDSLHVETQQLGADGEARVSVKVTNTGARTGEETVQLYLRELVSPIARPVSELKQFRRIMLKPGESQGVEFTITRDQLMSLRPDMRFAVDPGAYSVAIGPNSFEVTEAQFEVPALKYDRIRKASIRGASPIVSSKRAKTTVSGR